MDLLPQVARAAFLGLALLAAPLADAARRVAVDGFGLLGNAELLASLRLLELDQGQLDSQKIDDAAFLLSNRLRQSGFLDASVSATLTRPDNSQSKVAWPAEFEPQIPPGTTADAIRYHIEPGPLYYYQDVAVLGAEPLEPEEARAYFVPDRALFSRNEDRSYSPSIFAGQQKQLVAAYQNLGYFDAKIASATADIAPGSSQVAATVRLDKGPLYRVAKLQTSIYEDGVLQSQTETPFDAVYNRAWIDEQARVVRNESYRLGFPDTRIDTRIASSERLGDTMSIVVHLEARRSKRYTIRSVSHEGATDTRPHILDRKTRLQPGDPLDITAVEAARRRLSRLGVFKRVDLEYESQEPGARDVIFNYENSQRVVWQLVLGYGSYEQFRFGVLGRRSNLFGRAQSLSLEAIQSIKSTKGKVAYSIPEIFGESIDAKLEANYLDRQELFFDREERGVSIGLATRIDRYKLDLGLDYAFERKQSSEPRFNADFRLENTNIGSVLLRAAHSAVDNVLYPSSGYDVTTALRYASRTLGGETEFIRPEASASYHRKLGKRWLAHLAASGGLVSSPGENIVAIPYSERFIVGGENSLRGFRRGEAGPIDSNGIPIGAEAFALANAELEYPLFNKLAAVIFVDAARVWGSTGTFEIYDDFVNLGLGFRYRTVVGPVRLEYGHNLDPRPTDPKGTLHLSIGFPF